MKRDTTLFAPDLKVDVSGEEIPFDTSHIYTGEIYGEMHLFLLESSETTQDICQSVVDHVLLNHEFVRIM